MLINNFCSTNTIDKICQIKQKSIDSLSIQKTKIYVNYKIGLTKLSINNFCKNSDSQLYSSNLKVGIHGTPQNHPLCEYFLEDINGIKQHNPSARFVLKDIIIADPLAMDYHTSCANQYIWDVSNTKFCNQTMSGHHINPIIGNKANSYSILSPAGGDIDKFGNPLNTLTTLIRSEGTGKYFNNMNIGDSIEVAGIVSNNFACPKYEYPLISICMGSGAVPHISMIKTRISDANKHGKKPASHLIITSFKDENNEYKLLEELKQLAGDKNNNLILINTFTQSQNRQHLFDRDVGNLNSIDLDNIDIALLDIEKLNIRNLGIDKQKYILHQKKNFYKILNFLYKDNIHIRLSGYKEVDKQFLCYINVMAKNLKCGFLYKNITQRYASLYKNQYIRAEGSVAKGIQANGHEVMPI